MTTAVKGNKTITVPFKQATKPGVQCLSCPTKPGSWKVDCV